ncbi:hypothetical protein VTK26DRAFT_6744 [Humicola hyalothermophila]
MEMNSHCERVAPGLVVRWARLLVRRAPLAPLQFSATGFQVITDSQPLEEKRLDDVRTGHYYPVHIGDVYASKYQVLGKLGPEDKTPKRLVTAMSSGSAMLSLIGMLGPTPPDLIKRGSEERSPEFLRPAGQWNAGIAIFEGMSLESSEENLDGAGKAEFLSFIRSMLQQRPEGRKRAKELLKDPWLKS